MIGSRSLCDYENDHNFAIIMGSYNYQSGLAVCCSLFSLPMSSAQAINCPSFGILRATIIFIINNYNLISVAESVFGKCINLM